MKGILGRTRISTPAGWLLLVVALATGLSLSISSGSLWWRNLANAQPRGVDFLPLYAGGRLLMEERQALYDLDRQWAIEAEILAPYTLPEGVFPYNYPPFFALLLVPLAALPFPVAYAVATALNLLTLAITVQLLARRLALNTRHRRWLLVITFASTAVYVTLVQGQTSLLVLLLLSLFVLDLRDGREKRPGMWAGLLLFKPQLLPLPFLILAWRRRWQGLAVGVAVVMGLLLLSWALVGAEGLRQHLLLGGQMAVADGTLGIHPLAMHSLRALVYFSLPAPWDSIGWGLGSLLLVMGTLWLLRPVVEDGSTLAWRWSGAVVAILLLAAHLNTHDLALLLLPTALILENHRQNLPLSLTAGLLGFSLLPLVTAWTWSATGTYWPVTSAALLLAFLLCVGRARASFPCLPGTTGNEN